MVVTGFCLCIILACASTHFDRGIHWPYFFLLLFIYFLFIYFFFIYLFIYFFRPLATR